MAAPFAFNPKDYPATPGVYLMKNAQGRILYVGKAKSLRARLGSYFGAGPHAPKTLALTAKIASIAVLLTSSEKEALLLEASLIKKHRPRYNIVLRDDKSHILFKLDRSGDYPRLTLTRRVIRDGSVYFGPFTSALAARTTWRELTKMFKLRKCSDKSFANRARPCLYHHIGQCHAPCRGLISPADYAAITAQVEAFLTGKSRELIRDLETRMQTASRELRFEEAARLRDLVRAMRATVEGQAAVLPNLGDADAIGVFASETGLGLSLVFVRQGRILDQAGFFWPGQGEADAAEAVSGFIGQYYGPGKFIPPRVIVPLALEDAAVLGEVLTLARGEKARVGRARGQDENGLLAIATANARETANKRSPDHDPAARLAEALHLPATRGRIESVDISHLGGQQTLAGHVVFEDGRFATEHYRQYKVPGAGGDDYLALAAWTARRIESGPPYPDLVLIDGGKGQLAAVERALAQAGHPGLFSLAAIAKQSHSAGALGDQVFTPGRKNPLPLKPGSPELLFLQHLRDAVHRFVLSRQRRARRAPALASQILALPGIGPKTARKLWDRFPSLAAMRQASPEELTACGIPAKRAAALAARLAGLPPEPAAPAQSD